jgi:hypothetical protein
VLELVPTEADVVLCAASAEAVDAVAGVAEPVRVAPDEVLLLGPAGTGGATLATASELAVAIDDDAVVLDATDGWAIWTLEGDDARMAFSHLSALRLPDAGVIQGEVAHVHAKVVVRPDRVHMLVPAMWGEHLRVSVLREGAHLGVRERADREAWPAPKRPRKKRA